MADRVGRRRPNTIVVPPAAIGGSILLRNGRHCEIHVFPPEERLLRDVLDVAARLGVRRLAEEDLRTELETALRTWYPRLVIRARDPFATFETSDALWYVFRDGAVRRRSPHRDQLHQAMATARDLAAESAGAIERARSTLAMANAGRPGRVAGKRADVRVETDE